MTYKIGVLGNGGSYTDLGPINSLASDNFIPELIWPRLNHFPLTPYDRAITALGNIDCAIQAEKDGFHAVFINTVGDYGINAMRSATNILIVGAGESTMAMCSNISSNFSIVTVWPPKLNFIYQERITNCAMENRCVSIRNIVGDKELNIASEAGDIISRMNRSNSSILTRAIEEIKLAVEEDGAESIILGCTCMAKIAPEIADQVNIPVLEPVRTGYKTTETILSLGLMHSDITFSKAKSENTNALDNLISGKEFGILNDADCDFCVVDEDK